MAERIANFIRSIWKELKIVVVLIFAMHHGSLSRFLPDGVDRGDLEQAFKATKAAFGTRGSSRRYGHRRQSAGSQVCFEERPRHSVHHKEASFEIIAEAKIMVVTRTVV